MVLACALALVPLPLVIVGREFISLYHLSRASMEHTLQKGDVLMVEKLPGAFEDQAKRYRPFSGSSDSGADRINGQGPVNNK